MEELRPFKVQLKRPATNILPVGAGAFGKVYGISYNGAPCIAKCLHNILMGRGMYEAVPGDQTKSLFAKFVKECVLHSKLRHPNIVQFIGVEYGNDPNNYDLDLVMERMDTNLESCLEEFPNIPLAIKLSVLRDVSAGLLYLHSFNPPIIHGDLTTTNILLTHDWKAKIADFGNSVDENILSTAPGALIYMPPEAFVKPLRYDTKLDNFSFGIVSLFTSLQVKACDYGKRDELIQRLGADQQLECIYQIVTWCCEKNQSKRPSSMDLNTKLQDLCSCNTHILHMMVHCMLDQENARLKETIKVLEMQAMEQCTNHGSQPHGQDTILLHQENASLKEKVVMLEMQLADYKEDFAAERKDREKAVENTEKIKSEFKTLQKDLEQHKVLLEDMETANGVQTQNCKQMLRELKGKLDAAREEIAVKVAQVKQYQKQVEAYKGQVAQHVTNEEAQKEAFETLIIEIDKGTTEPCRRNTNDEQ
eukprot:Em0002g1169a